MRLFKMGIKMDEKYGYKKLSITWKFKDNSMPNYMDEKLVEKLAYAIHEKLSKEKIAEVNGFEIGPGQIDILIFGNKSDENTDDVYKEILEIYKNWQIPIGSCITKFYKDKKIISDEIS